MSYNQEKMQSMLSDTVKLLCRNGLPFKCNLKVQGLIGVTVDNSDVILVHFNETLYPEITQPQDRESTSDELLTLLEEPLDTKSTECSCAGDNSSNESTKDEQFYSHPFIKIEQDSDRDDLDYTEAEQPLGENSLAAQLRVQGQSQNDKYKSTAGCSENVQMKHDGSRKRHRSSWSNVTSLEPIPNEPPDGFPPQLKFMLDTSPVAPIDPPGSIQRNLNSKPKPTRCWSKPHKCPICSKGFTQKANLGEHHLRVHMNVSCLCKYCGKKYRSLSVFIKHVKNIHKHEGSYRTACASQSPVPKLIIPDNVPPAVCDKSHLPSQYSTP